ncbi:MAG: hypothetical protein KKA79_00670 [Nanoarchaeota archaeon]|nr:hypothetical protein [Nanoarchaeota archaeon]
MPRGDGTGPDGKYTNCQPKDGQQMYGGKRFGQGQGRGMGYGKGFRKGSGYGNRFNNPYQPGMGREQQQDYQPNSNTLETILNKLLDVIERIFEKPEKKE